MVRILLIEDEPAHVLMTREGIRRSAVRSDLVIALDGDQALKLLESLSFDLVVVDLSVRKHERESVLEQCRVPGGPAVVVFSGSRHPADRQKALGLGAWDYIVKPKKFDEYVWALQLMLARWGEKSAAAAEP